LAKIRLICEGCGGSVELDDTHEFGFCTSCKTKVLIKSDNIINEVTQNITKHVYGHQGKDVAELVVDGNKLLAIHDEKGANAKFKNAIDSNPQSWDAWFGYATTGGDRTDPLSCVSAYRSTYSVATEESQTLATFNAMVKHLPDKYLGEALIKAYKVAQPKKRDEMFNLVLGMIGRNASEIVKVVLDLCPEDWCAWFAQAKIRQPRVRWCDRRLSEDADEVLQIFLRAYQLAERESVQAKKVVLSHIETMEDDDTYKNFLRAFRSRINADEDDDEEGITGGLKRFARGLGDRILP